MDARVLSHAERSIRCLGNVSVIDMGTQILTTKVIPAHDADTLGYLFGELVESCDGFAVVHPEGLDLGARMGGSTESFPRGLDW